MLAANFPNEAGFGTMEQLQAFSELPYFGARNYPTEIYRIARNRNQRVSLLSQTVATSMTSN